MERSLQVHNDGLTFIFRHLLFPQVGHGYPQVGRWQYGVPGQYGLDYSSIGLDKPLTRGYNQGSAVVYSTP
jgi:hypothetical protein